MQLLIPLILASVLAVVVVALAPTVPTVEASRGCWQTEVTRD